jgi:hypothetical protein
LATKRIACDSYCWADPANPCTNTMGSATFSGSGGSGSTPSGFASPPVASSAADPSDELESSPDEHAAATTSIVPTRSAGSTSRRSVIRSVVIGAHGTAGTEPAGYN